MTATPVSLFTAQSVKTAQAKAVGSKLAADVNAAAESLENLKRLLLRQLPEPIQTKLQRKPDFYAEVTSIPATLPSQLPPMMSVVPQARVAPTLLPAVMVHSAEPRHIEIRGFFAGFALSAAIGALLYIILASG